MKNREPSIINNELPLNRNMITNINPAKMLNVDLFIISPFISRRLLTDLRQPLFL